MAQKVFPRSLRSPNQASTHFAFFGENNYAVLWKKAVKVTGELFSFAEKNMLYKKKNKVLKKNKNKKYKYKTFMHSTFFVSTLSNSLKVSPVLFKFNKQSLSNKYNPIKAVYKVRRSLSPISKFSFKKNLKKK
jgi:hypothetical protein